MKSRCSQHRTCRVVGMSKPRPSTEILTAMLMPANRRLLFPITYCRALFRDWKRDGNTDCRISNILFDFELDVSLLVAMVGNTRPSHFLCDRDATRNHFKLNHGPVCCQRPFCCNGGQTKGLPFFSKLLSHLAQLHTACWWPPYMWGGRKRQKWQMLHVNAVGTKNMTTGFASTPQAVVKGRGSVTVQRSWKGSRFKHMHLKNL